MWCLPTFRFSRSQVFDDALRVIGRLFWSLGVAALSFCQVPGAVDPQVPVIKTDVRLVLVPVVVTDNRGHHVTGLKASDFKVFEDDIPQEIVSVATSAESLSPDFARPIQAQQNALAENLRARTASVPNQPSPAYLICVDTLHSAFQNFTRVRDALAKFFEQENGRDAQYAILALGKEPKLLLQATTDSKAVLSALRDKAFTQAIRDSETSRVGDEAQQLTELMKKYCVACGCTTFPKLRTEEAHCNARRPLVQAFLDASSERNWDLTTIFLNALRAITEAAATLPTATTVLLLSDGYSRFPGRELYGIVSAFEPEQPFPANTRDTGSQLERIVRVAVQHNIRFYTVDSRGVYTQASLAGGGGFDASRGLDSTYRGRPTGTPSGVDLMALSVARENTDGLSLLARATGGLFFESSNDILKGVRRTFADGREYYVLAYYPRNQNMVGYKRIRVAVRDTRLTATAKAGYWGTP
jgi:VWFA-related protein